MTPRILSAALAILLTCAAYGKSSAQSSHGTETGLSISQAQSLLRALPPLPGTIQAIQFLRRDRFWIDRAAILTQGKDGGWQIFVLHLEDSGKFSLEWRSGRLTDSFAVSSVNQFRTRDIGTSQQVLEFSGCAAHNCPDVFSILLYIPSRRAAFTATYILGKITYSMNSESPKNHEYKDALDELLKEHKN
jgi:hypothetical protein